MRIAKRKKPNRVDFDNDKNDWTVLVLASMGFSNNCIHDMTGMSNGQIYYRLKLGGLQGYRKEFRDGKSDSAKKLMKLGIGKKDALSIQKALHA